MANVLVLFQALHDMYVTFCTYVRVYVHVSIRMYHITCDLLELGNLTGCFHLTDQLFLNCH